MVKETIDSYQRLIPAIIDLDGKKDYTLGVIMPTTVIVPSNSEDGVGEITVSMETPPDYDNDD